MVKAIVVGGMGFIGSHLTERLLAEGVDVTVLDNLSTGRRSNLEHLEPHPRLKFFEVDVASSEPLEPLFEGADWVFHLAGLADLIPSIEKPFDYFTHNVTGTVRVLEAARNQGVSRLVYAASSSSYGLPDIFPTPETAPLRPEHPYAFSKYLGEQAVLHWGRVYHLGVVSLRLFNVFGPRARTTGAYGAVFGVFLAQKLRNHPLTIVGDGNQTRDFIYVTDVAEAFVSAARSGVQGEVFNVGSGGTCSIRYLAQLIGGPRVFVPKRPGEPDCTFADISKIQNTLGWKPRVPFEEGVRRLLEHLGDWKDAPVWTPDAIAGATREWFQRLSPRMAEVG
ncbi:SDR family oxidoreductase [bacterium]|nr:SDR family oxidoreductase [bacterium]